MKTVIESEIEDAAANLLEHASASDLVEAAERIAVEQSIDKLGALRLLRSELQKNVSDQFAEAEDLLRDDEDQSR